MAKPKTKDEETAKPRGFRLDDADRVLKAEDSGIEVHLKGPDNEKLFYENGDGSAHPVVWVTAGTYSESYRRAEEEVSRERAKEGGDPTEFRAMYTDRLKIAARLCRELRGVFDHDDEPLEPEPEKLLKVLEKYDWIYPQVRAGMGDHAGFTKAALKG